MGKKVMTIEEQINLLESRGMVMDRKPDKIEEILLDVGYYRLGFYWHPFEIDKKHNFKKGTKFSTIVALYYLDVDLKHLLMKALNRIEIHFKTQLIYYGSNKYTKNPTWFADNKIVSKEFDLLSVYTERLKKKNKHLKNHHKKYPNDVYAPAWKTLEFFTFGQVIRIYKSLINTNLKEEIASKYTIKSIKTFENYIGVVLFIRNICAHNALLFDSKTPKGIIKTPMIKFNNNNRDCLDLSIKVILYFLKQISNNRHKIIEKELEAIFKEASNNESIKMVIKNKIGHVKI